MKLTEKFQPGSQWVFIEEDTVTAHFTNPEGLHLSINHFNLVPDIGAELSDLNGVRAVYRDLAERNSAALIEADVVDFCGMQSVCTIIKIRMQPTGLVFIGSYTLPFANESYVLKIQATETGITGIREAAIIAMEPHFEIDEETGKIAGWEQDPYDPSYRGTFMMNRADDRRYDERFPDHPLSLVRKHLRELRSSLTIAKEIQDSAPFQFKKNSGSTKSWWRLWKNDV